jgi:hypothetical protein
MDLLLFSDLLSLNFNATSTQRLNMINVPNLYKEKNNLNCWYLRLLFQCIGFVRLIL